jgi:hypothetical protein
MAGCGLLWSGVLKATINKAVATEVKTVSNHGPVTTGPGNFRHSEQAVYTVRGTGISKEILILLAA